MKQNNYLPVAVPIFHYDKNLTLKYNKEHLWGTIRTMELSSKQALIKQHGVQRQSFAQMGLEGILTLPSTMLAHMIEIDLFWSYWTKFNKQILIRLETKYKN